MRTGCSSWRSWLACLFVAGICPSQLTAAAPLQSAANEFIIRTWNPEDGLPHIAITTINQTPDGYLWLGSFLNMARFDGARFSISDYSNSGIPGPMVLKIFTDFDGSLWIGSDAGLARLKNGRWQRFTKDQGYPGGLVRSITRTRENQLIANAGSNLIQFQNEAWIAFPLPERGSDDGRDVTCLTDSSGTLWARGIQWAGRHFQGAWQTILTPAQVGTNTIMGMTASARGGVWIADMTTIRRFEGPECVQTIERPAPFREDSLYLFEDSRGNLWAGGYTQGVVVFKADGATLRCTIQDGLENNATLTIFEDNENNIWIGSNGGGLARLKPRTFQAFASEVGLVQPVVNSIAAWDSNNLLVATHGSGLVRFDGQRFGGTIDSPDGKLRSQSWVLSVVADAPGKAWAGVYDEGLFRIEGNKVTQIPAEQVSGRHVRALYIDSKGRLWTGSEAGLTFMESGRFDRCGTETGLPQVPVIAISEDSDGNIWCALANGTLYSRRDGVFTQYKPPTSAGQLGNIVSMFRDSKGDMWTGSFSGKLGRFHGGKFTVYSWSDGLPVWNVVGFGDDQEGNLWLAAVEGIARVTRASLDALANGTASRLDSLLFDKSDGLRTVGCRDGLQPTVVKAPDGKLWFASVKGLASVDPGKVMLKSVAPPTWIEEIGVDGKWQSVDRTSTTVHQIAPGAARIQIRYTGIQLGSPERVGFQYRLDGLDRDWVDAGDTRVAQFQDLHPGEYRFRVQAHNREGLRNEKGATLAFHVQPFYWQTLWFRVVLMLGIGGSLVAFASWIQHERHRRRADAALRRAHQELEARVQDRTGELRSANEQLERGRARLMAMSHRLMAVQESERRAIARELHDEVGQVLTSLKIILEMSGRQAQPALAGALAEAKNLSSELMERVRQLSLNLRPPMLDDMGLLTTLEWHFKRFTKQTGIRVEFKTSGLTSRLDLQLETAAYRIIQEALTNVARHAKVNEVAVSVERTPAELRIEVTDRGTGFDPAAAFRLARSNGLSGMRERVDLLQGQFAITSAVGTGTRIDVTIPITSANAPARA